MEIINDKSTDDLLQILSHYKADPILLTSICKFGRKMLSKEDIVNNMIIVEKKIDKM